MSMVMLVMMVRMVMMVTIMTFMAFLMLPGAITGGMGLKGIFLFLLPCLPLR